MNFFPFSLCLCPSVFVRCLFVFSVRLSVRLVLLSVCPSVRGGSVCLSLSVCPSVRLCAVRLFSSLPSLSLRLSFCPSAPAAAARRAVHRRAQGLSVIGACVRRPCCVRRAPTERERESVQDREREREGERKTERNRERVMCICPSACRSLRAPIKSLRK